MKCGLISISRKAPSRRGRRWFCMTGMWCWAAVGLKRRYKQSCNGDAAAAECFDFSAWGAGGFCVDLAAGDGAGADLSAEQNYLCDAWAEGEIGGEGAAYRVGGCGRGMASSFWRGWKSAGTSAENAGGGAVG